MYDRVVIQDILKEIAQTQQVDLNAKQRFKGELSYTLCWAPADGQWSSSTKPMLSPVMLKLHYVVRWKST
jgi:hypothetical protein